jgi:hypothetical protein
VGYLGCFHNLAIVSSAAINIDVIFLHILKFYLVTRKSEELHCSTIFVEEAVFSSLYVFGPFVKN